MGEKSCWTNMRWKEGSSSLGGPFCNFDSLKMSVLGRGDGVVVISVGQQRDELVLVFVPRSFSFIFGCQ